MQFTLHVIAEKSENTIITSADLQSSAHTRVVPVHPKGSSADEGKAWFTS